MQVSETTDLFEYNIQMALSDIMMEVLDDEHIDADEIVSLALYLQFAAITAIMEKDSHLIQQLFQADDDAGFRWLETEESRAAVSAIAMDVIAQQTTASWLIKWMQVCANELKQATTCYSNDLHKALLFRRIIYLIHKRSGLTKNAALIVYDATRYVLAEGLLHKEKII